MFPLSDENPTFRSALTTMAIIGACVAVWVLVQGAGYEVAVAGSVCKYGLIPAELTHGRPEGFSILMGDGLGRCLLGPPSDNWLTPLTSMFLHGSWGHIGFNCLFLWVFGNNVEDVMGRGRFLVFYLICGLVAAGAQVAIDPGSPVPTVGASGAISGVMGAYLLLYPRVRVKMFFPPIFIFRFPAWMVLIWWFATQVLSGLPQLIAPSPEISGGVAVWAHIGGFVAGVVLSGLFEDRDLVARHRAILLRREVF